MSRFSIGCAALIGATILSATNLASASSEKVIYSFPANSLGYAPLQEDDSGNLYGTTRDERNGTVYQLRQRRGPWLARVIHVFTGAKDGAAPVAGLTPDRTSNTFYGTTTAGGAYGRGNVFSLVQSGRKWRESVLHNFSDATEIEPSALLTRDKTTGVLYGVTFDGGTGLCGTAFSLNPTNALFNVLYNFKAGNDGCEPRMQLREGPKAGTLFGSTNYGGAEDCGTLFQLTASGGNWTESVLHTFTCGDDGGFPEDSTVLADDAGHSMYGVATAGGAQGDGVVFQSSEQHHKWMYSVIYSFSGGIVGAAPAGLHLDRATGALYGTTISGGSANLGVVFKLENINGAWTETVLHSFAGGSDGAVPLSRPILDGRTGVLYGTTDAGGTNDSGTVYAVTP